LDAEALSHDGKHLLAFPSVQGGLSENFCMNDVAKARKLYKRRRNKWCQNPRTDHRRQIVGSITLIPEGGYYFFERTSLSKKSCTEIMEARNCTSSIKSPPIFLYVQGTQREAAQHQ
jgi:hypothetical protein